MVQANISALMHSAEVNQGTIYLECVWWHSVFLNVCVGVGVGASVSQSYGVGDL